MKTDTLNLVFLWVKIKNIIGQGLDNYINYMAKCLRILSILDILLKKEKDQNRSIRFKGRRDHMSNTNSFFGSQLIKECQLELEENPLLFSYH